MVSSLAELAHVEMLRSLDKQEQVLDELRSRTGLLLAASSLAASFVGGRAVDHGESVFVLLALLAFAGSVLGCVYVLVPRPYAFTFSLDGSAVFEQLYAMRDDLDEIHRRLAYDLHRFWESNDAKIRPLFRAFRWACIALVVEIALLVVSVSDTLV